MKNFYHCQVTVTDGPKKPNSLQELRDCLSDAREAQCAEIWVDHGKFPALCALINGDLGWLMFLRYDGDPGFSSRNPKYEGAQNAVLEFFLCNGQRDEYPTAWTYPKKEVFEAVMYFASKKASPTSITWFNDSGDGTESPDDAFVNPD